MSVNENPTVDSPPTKRRYTRSGKPRAKPTRLEFLQVRVTMAEFADLKRMANEAGVTMSALVRASLFGQAAK